MKKARKITAVVAAMVALCLCAGVAYVWNAQGCEMKSLILGCAWYIACTAAIWAVIDQQIKEATK